MNGTPTFYINGVRYDDDSWDEEMLLAAIKQTYANSERNQPKEKRKKKKKKAVAFIDLFEIIYRISQTNMVDKQMWRNPRRQTGGLESKLKLVADTVADDGSSMSGTLFRIYY